MRRRNYRSAAEFRVRAPKDAVADVRKFGAFGTTEVAQRMKQYAELYTPIGGRISKPRTTGTYGHPAGLMRRSWTLRSLAGAHGRVWALGNSAPHAQIINMGRRRNKHAYKVRLRGRFFASGGRTYTVPAGRRWLGSRQAPNILRSESGERLGAVTGPAYRTVRRFQKEISALAAKRAEGA